MNNVWRKKQGWLFLVRSLVVAQIAVWAIGWYFDTGFVAAILGVAASLGIATFIVGTLGAVNYFRIRQDNRRTHMAQGFESAFWALSGSVIAYLLVRILNLARSITELHTSIQI